MARTLGAILPLLLAGCGASTPRDQLLRVLTYNIHHGEGVDGRIDLPRLAAVIRKADADVVALQEVDRGTGRSGGVDQAARLCELAGFPVVVFGRAIDYDGGEYGVAVLCRGDIQNVRTYELPALPDHETRCALELTLPTAGGPVRFVNTHLDHTPDDLNRMVQVDRLNELFVDDQPVPTVLAGDLNAPPGSDPMIVLSDHWRNTARRRPRPTFPSDRPQRQIDYVLVRPHERWRVLETRVIDERVASDHRPLLVVLGW